MENKSNSSCEGFFKDDIMKGVCIALVVVFLFASGNFLGSLTNVKKNTAVETEDPVVITTTAAPQTAAPTTAPTTAPTSEAPAGNETADTTAAPAADTTTAAPASDAPSTGAPQSKAEIVAYFNDAANKVKTEATQVVRNYEDNQHNPEKLVLPSALQSIGEGLIGKFLKRNDTPVTMATKDEIVAGFPVSGQTYSSKLTDADVKEATCTDEGSNYSIKLVLNDCVDPAEGTGVNAAFDIIKPSDVTDNAPMVTKFSCNYYNNTIECKVDKATGHMVSATYTQPIVLDVTAKVVLTLDATVGMTFIKDYTITY